ncbi:MAG: protein translocase subunit SecD [Thermoanaerobaculia bacterium]
MNKNLLWKIILIVAVIAVCVIAVVPTKSTPEPINLGLDLKGGTHLVMQVNLGDAMRAETDQASERLKTQARTGNMPVPTTRRVNDTMFLAVPPAGVDANDYINLAETHLPDFEGKRTAEGIEFGIRPLSMTAIEQQTVAQSVETIRNRVDELGVTEPLVAPQGKDRIVIQLPGVDDPERVKGIIRTTAQLQFRIVEGSPGPSEEAVRASLPPEQLSQIEVLPGDSFDAFGRVTGKEFYAVQNTVPVTGTDLKTARVQKGGLGEPIIGFSLTADGAVKFGNLTGSNVNRRLAIVLDNKIKSAPTINSRIDGEGVIEGRFTPQQASDLALVLRSGSLPASLTTLEERTVGPSLGRDSIRQGLTASVVGFGLMTIFVIVYYKGAGINAVVALSLNLLILLGMMAYFKATLTLPGIVGSILTLGMAIDSNVLVFERIKEEFRGGKSVRASIESGFTLAFGTIIDTHLTTIIAALFLLQFGTGPVKGFAVTLLIGLAASVFTAFFVSRVMFDLIYNRPNTQPARISI